MNYRLIIFVFGLFLSFLSTGQTVFRGKILDDSTKQPIEGAKIGVSDQGVGVITNANGSFNYRKYQHAIGDRSELIITAKGYEDVILKGAQIRALYNKSSKFVLTPNKKLQEDFKFENQKNIAIFWDASLSSNKRDFRKEWDFLEAYFSQLATTNVSFYVFNDKVISNKDFIITKDITTLKTFTKDIVYEGATSYTILPKLDVETVLLFSDGNPVLGEWQDERNIPYYAITTLPRSNEKFLKSLALYTTGCYVNLFSTSIAESIEQIKNRIPFKEEKNVMASLKGFVKTASGPIQGASITIKGDLEEFFTKADGAFSIPAQEGDILQVKYLGMYPKEMLVESMGNLEVNLKPLDELLDEVVLEGNKRKQSKTVDAGFGDEDVDSYGFDVKTITSKDIRPDMQFLTDIVRGRYAGVIVNGFGSSARATIRGGQRPAIWVIDGSIYEEVPLWVEVQDVASIAIVKGNQASIRYGSVASGGAFLVRTRAYTNRNKNGEIIDQALVKGNDYNEQVEQINLEALKPNYVKQLQGIKNKDEQYTMYENLSAANTTNATFFIDMALHFQKEYPEKAKLIRGRLAEIAQGNANVLRVLAYLYENASEYENALAVYERVILLAPGESQSYRDLANAYEETGHYDKAFELYVNMLSEQIRGVNFRPIDKALGHELLHLVARHKDMVDYTRLPEEWLFNELRIDLRMVIEWSDKQAPFEFQFVNPQDKFFKWNHTIFDNKQRLEDEVKTGFQFEEFIIDEAPHGLWRVNIEYLGEERYITIPPYLKYTIYRDYGTFEERKETIIIKLTKEIGKVQLHEFLL